MKFFAKIVVAAGTIGLWVLPMAMLPFVSLMPYLHSHLFIVRAIFGVCAGLALMGIWAYIMGPKAKEAMKRSFPKLKDKLWGTAIFILFCLVPAYLGANLLGPLVLGSSNSAFSATFQVVELEETMQKRARTELTLACPSTGQKYEITLMRKYFPYLGLSVGQRIHLKGVQNIFGSYVSDVSRDVIMDLGCK
jgi:hypothetical protein